MRILSILFFSGAPLNHRKLIFEKKKKKKKVKFYVILKLTDCDIRVIINDVFWNCNFFVSVCTMSVKTCALIFSCSAVNNDALFIDEVKNKDWVLKGTWGHTCSNVYFAQLYSSIFFYT